MRSKLLFIDKISSNLCKAYIEILLLRITYLAKISENYAVILLLIFLSTSLQ